MKTTIRFFCVITFALINISSFSQVTSYGNFKLEEQELIYQKIFLQDSITLEKLAEYFSKQSNISGVSVGETQLDFDIADMQVDYMNYGFSQVATPSVIQTGRFSAHASVTVKEGKYRVSLRSITFTGDLGYKKVSPKDKLTNYSCRDNGKYISGDWTKPNTLGLLDKAFTDKVLYREPKTKKEAGDW